MDSLPSLLPTPNVNLLCNSWTMHLINPVTEKNQIFQLKACRWQLKFTCSLSSLSFFPFSSHVLFWAINFSRSNSSFWIVSMSFIWVEARLVNLSSKPWFSLLYNEVKRKQKNAHLKLFNRTLKAAPDLFLLTIPCHDYFNQGLFPSTRLKLPSKRWFGWYGSQK